MCEWCGAKMVKKFFCQSHEHLVCQGCAEVSNNLLPGNCIQLTYSVVEKYDLQREQLLAYFDIFRGTSSGGTLDLLAHKYAMQQGHYDEPDCYTMELP